jgi:leucyl aminopeptidase (aminopeptidase T)
MADPRVAKLAQVLVQYSLALQPGDEFELNTSPLAQELNLAVYREAVLAGANVLVSNGVPGASELFYRLASDAQLDHVSPIAVGIGYPESGSQNHSSVHWDMLCDIADSEIRVDRELFYKDGNFVS